MAVSTTASSDCVSHLACVVDREQATGHSLGTVLPLGSVVYSSWHQDPQWRGPTMGGQKPTWGTGREQGKPLFPEKKTGPGRSPDFCLVSLLQQQVPPGQTSISNNTSNCATPSLDTRRWGAGVGGVRRQDEHNWKPQALPAHSTPFFVLAQPSAQPSL
jgi:hypothetical protein